jgi:hypothetical protein
MENLTMKVGFEVQGSRFRVGKRNPKENWGLND